MKGKKWLAGLLCVFMIAGTTLGLTGCGSIVKGDDRTPSEKVMEYMAANGGSGSPDSKVKTNIPALSADATCSVTLDGGELIIEYTANGAFSSTDPLGGMLFTNIESNLATGETSFLHKATFSILSTTVTTQGIGSFDSTTYTKNDLIEAKSISSSLGKGATQTDQFKTDLNEGIQGGLDSFAAYLAESKTGVTLADFGFEAYE